MKHIREAREARHNCIQLAREYPHESAIFVRLARQWQHYILRQVKRAQTETTKEHT